MDCGGASPLSKARSRWRTPKTCVLYVMPGSVNYAGCFRKNAVSEQFSSTVEKVFSLRAPKARLDHSLAVERSGTPGKRTQKSCSSAVGAQGKKTSPARLQRLSFLFSPGPWAALRLPRATFPTRLRRFHLEGDIHVSMIRVALRAGDFCLTAHSCRIDIPKLFRKFTDSGDVLFDSIA